MKNIFLLIVLLTSVSFSQSYDTLFYGDTRAVLKNPFGSGYIAGTNSYNDIGKFQRFDIYDEVMIRGAIIYMGYMNIVGEPDSIYITFREMAVDSAPGNLITRIGTTLNQFDTTSGVAFMLNTPFPVLGGGFVPEHIFIGLEWTVSIDDTFGLVTDINGEGDYANRAWEMFDDGTLQRFNEDSDFSWNLNADIWIAALYTQGITSLENENNNKYDFSLSQNFPNPFNPITVISYQLSVESKVSLKVFDVLGNEVAVLVDKEEVAGNYKVEFDTSELNLTSGIYFYQLSVGNFIQTKKMTLMK